MMKNFVSKGNEILASFGIDNKTFEDGMKGING
jgi:hypothetical protein